VVRCDRYGNLVTVAEESFLRETFGDVWREIAVRAGDRRAAGIRLSYDAVEEGELVLTIGSAGTLEVSCRLGNASEITGLGAGAHVVLEGPCGAEGPA
jgi:S-adenosylmethionine hydrolase